MIKTSLSLRQRALFTLVPFFLIFFLAFAWLLYGSYERSLQLAANEQMMLQIRLLLADSELNDENRIELSQLREPRLTVPGGGLYALILGSNNERVWESPSIAMMDTGQQQIPEIARAIAAVSLGRQQFFQTGNGEFVAAFSIAFERDDPLHGNQSPILSEVFTYLLIDSGEGYRQQLGVFRNTLGVGMGIGLAVFTALQLLLLKWLFAPLRSMVTELNEVERGERSAFVEKYPRELSLLTSQLNHFIDSENRQRERYRNTLTDLAHSLKTPLAALRAAFSLGDPPEKNSHENLEQIKRMEQIVAHQLRRATKNASVGLGQRTEIVALINRVVDALRKVYRDKQVTLQMAVPASCFLPWPEDDCFELLGNLLDNAFKYCDQRVYIALDVSPDQDYAVIVIENDGGQIGEAQAGQILRRGVRLDESAEGQGIGLAVVGSLLKQYRGELEFSTPAPGGTRLELKIPLKVSAKQ